MDLSEERIDLANYHNDWSSCETLFLNQDTESLPHPLRGTPTPAASSVVLSLAQTWEDTSTSAEMREKLRRYLDILIRRKSNK